MTTPVSVSPAVLSWAVDRSGRDEVAVAKRFPHFPEWLSGERAPSLSELAKFADFVHAPFGTFFLPAPPDERLPIPDFRTMADTCVSTRPSADLLDTIYACQLRQSWYRDYALREELGQLAFVGSTPAGSEVTSAAGGIAQQLGFDMAARAALHTWEEARRFLIRACEDLGVLVCVTSVVGADTTRLLNPEEFRGFALCDDTAPLLFVNAADTQAAQIFTLIHELAHIWAGDSGLSDARPWSITGHDKERWANRVAAEVLVPTDVLRSTSSGIIDDAELRRLAQLFKVSTLVVLTSLHDVGRIGWDEYRSLYQAERDRLFQILAARPKTGGDAYKTMPFRVGGRQFVRAVVSDALAGDTLYRDAYALLGVASHSTFETLAKKVMA